MGRKVALATAMLLVAVMSVVLVGGQVGTGFLWWGNHEPIYIYGDGDFTVQNGVMSGSGTELDPYIIEGWRIDAPDADYGIYIDHTSAYVVIRDCVIERSRQAGIYLNTARNVTVMDSQIGLSDTAVHLLASRNNTFVGNVIKDCRYGVVMAAGSQNNLVAGNSFFDNGLSAYDPQQWNRWFNDECCGNYWSDYDGYDANGDGIGDIAHVNPWDRYPLMNPPVEWTGIETAGLSYSGNWVAPDGSLVVTSQTPIALTSVDPGAGVQEIRYSIDNGPWTPYDGPIYLQGPDGPRRVTYFAIDRLGNHEPKASISLVLDNHAPETAIEFGEPQYVDDRGVWITSKTPITLRLVEHSTYGTTKTFYRVDGGAWQYYARPFTLYHADGPHQISFYSQNASGVTEAMKTVIVIKDDAPPSTRGQQPGTVVPVIGQPTSNAEDTSEEAADDASASSAAHDTPPPTAPVEETPPTEEPVVAENPVVVEVTSPTEPSETVDEPETVATAEPSDVQSPSETVEPPATADSQATEPQSPSETADF